MDICVSADETVIVDTDSFVLEDTEVPTATVYTSPARKKDLSVLLVSHPSGRRLGRRLNFGGGSEIVLGRSSRCDFALPEVESISRRHARFSMRVGYLYLEDLGSTNGVWVNSRQLTSSLRLAAGDEIGIGAVRLRVFPTEQADSLLRFELELARTEFELSDDESEN